MFSPINEEATLCPCYSGAAVQQKKVVMSRGIGMARANISLHVLLHQRPIAHLMGAFMAHCARSDCLHHLGSSKQRDRNLLLHFRTCRKEVASGPLPREDCQLVGAVLLAHIGDLAMVYDSHYLSHLEKSASLYSAVLVVLVVFEARNELAGSYIEDLAITIRGIVPTILVGRVAAGHARPDDSWSDNTTTSSIRFRNHSSSQNDSQIRAEPGRDTPSPHIQPDLEEGLEDGTELRVEGAAPAFSVHDCSARVAGTSTSVDCSVV
ncbi:uncharacterized protein ARMOST_17462 [Armillaria ostoyae]|uniref:Uncharacterized protein n=1 Tax=Armillaria ostoyae TaxID=47428 RepID=A0A284RZ69_ARMOS|nr:uncharacterized protein ARMOST_17462 [Armillaria ostoyae]